MKIVKKQIYLFFLFSLTTCPLFSAMEKNIVDELERELARNPEVNNFRRQFDQAIESNFIEVVRLLLRHGIDIQAPDVHGETPLHLAVILNHAKLAQLLINNGANIEAQNKYGMAPLHLAIGLSLPPIAQLLIDVGANINAQNKHGETPLKLAKFHNNQHMIQLLQPHKIK